MRIRKVPSNIQIKVIIMCTMRMMKMRGRERIMMMLKLFRSRALVTMLEKSADCGSKYIQRPEITTILAGNNWRILKSKSQLSPHTIFWMLGDQVVWLPLDVPEECWWGQVYKLPTRWDIALRYAIFLCLCPLDVEILNDNLARQLTRWEASELENHDPSQQIVFLWCRESFHLLYTEV